MSARWQRKGKAQESLLFVVTVVIMSRKEPTTDTSACTLTLERKNGVKGGFLTQLQPQK